MRLRKLAVAALAVSFPTGAVIGGTALTGGVATAGASAKYKANTPKPKPLRTMTTVTIAEPAKVENFAAIPVGIAMGEFAKTNLDVKLVQDPGGANAEPQELAQGAVQVVETGIAASALNAINSGVAMVYVGNPDFPNPKTGAGFYVNKKFLTKKGTFNKALAATFKMSMGSAGVSSSSSPQVQVWLEKSKESLVGVTQETLQPATMVLALKNGSIGGGFVNTPYWTTLTGDSTLVDVTGPPYATGVIAMYKPWADSHKAVATAIIRSLVRTDRTYLRPGYRKTSKVMSVISTYLGIPVATIDKSFPVIFSTTYSMTFVQPGLGSTIPTKKVLAFQQKGWIAGGGILQYTTALPTKKLMTTKFQKAALK